MNTIWIYSLLDLAQKITYHHCIFNMDIIYKPNMWHCAVPESNWCSIQLCDQSLQFVPDYQIANYMCFQSQHCHSFPQASSAVFIRMKLNKWLNVDILAVLKWKKTSWVFRVTLQLFVDAWWPSCGKEMIIQQTHATALIHVHDVETKVELLFLFCIFSNVSLFSQQIWGAGSRTQKGVQWSPSETHWGEIVVST